MQQPASATEAKEINRKTPKRLMQSAWLPAHYGRSKEFVLKWQNSLGRNL
jgi:hypothetical protein